MKKGKLIFNLVLLVFIAIVIVAVLPPRYFISTQSLVTDKAIEEYNFYSDVTDSIYYGEYLEAFPKDLSEFDYEGLSKLGANIEVDFASIISRSQEEYGNSWIGLGLGKAVMGLVSQLTRRIVPSNFSKQLIANAITLIGLILMLIFYYRVLAWGKLQPEEENKPMWLIVLKDLLLLVLFALITYNAYFIFPAIIKSFTSFPKIHFAQIDVGILPQIIAIFSLIKLLLAYFLIIQMFLRKRIPKFLFLIIIIPIFSIAYNDWSLGSQIPANYSMIDRQNYNSEQQTTLYNCSYYLRDMRQQYMIESEDREITLMDINLSEPAFPAMVNPDLYQIEVYNDSVIVKGMGNYKDNEGNIPKAKGIYYSNQDSLVLRIVN